MSHSEYEDHYYLPNEEYLNKMLEMQSNCNSSESNKDEVQFLKKELSQTNCLSKKTGISHSIDYEKKSIVYTDDSKLDDAGKRKGKWLKEEDDILISIVPVYGGKNWKKVAEHIKGRTPIQCLHRWSKILQPGLVKGPWTIEEDKKLMEWVKKEGATKWSLCSEYIQGRNGKQCRERWFNSLNPIVKKGNWTAEEDYKIYFLFKRFGGKWAKTAVFFEGRTENSIKNRFYSSLRRIASEKKKESTILMDDVNDYMDCNTSQSHVNRTSEDNIDKSNIDELLKFLPLAMMEATMKLMKNENISPEELRDYDNNLMEEVNKLQRKQSLVNSICDYRQSLAGEDTSFSGPQNQAQTINNISNINNPNSTINLNLNFNTSNNNQFILPANSQNGKEGINRIQQIKPQKQDFKNMDIFALEKEIYEICDNPRSLQFSQNQPNDTNLTNFDKQVDSIIEAIFSKNNIILQTDDQKECNVCLEHPANNSMLNQNGQTPLNTQQGQKPLNILNNMQQPQNSMSQINNGMINNQINQINQINQLKQLKNTQSNLWKLKPTENGTKKDAYFSLLDQLNDLETLVKSTKHEILKLDPVPEEKIQKNLNSINPLNGNQFDYQNNLFNLDDNMNNLWQGFPGYSNDLFKF
jgi:hypothetical protein